MDNNEAFKKIIDYNCNELDEKETKELEQLLNNSDDLALINDGIKQIFSKLDEIFSSFEHENEVLANSYSKVLNQSISELDDDNLDAAVGGVSDEDYNEDEDF